MAANNIKADITFTISDEAKQRVRDLHRRCIVKAKSSSETMSAIVKTPDDPWVKVGTTTIDGTLVDVANVLDVSSWPIDWARDAKAAIDLFMRAETPWLVGGRRLVAKRSHVNTIDETAIIHCDIVRRQSEIEAEHVARVAAEFHKDDAYAAPACPECGPHGNRGEVLLASSWAKCTTCAGGKPGDLWGEVRPSEEPKYWSSVANKMVTVAEALALGRSLRRPEDEADAEPELVEATTLSEMRGAELDNLRRHLTGDMSWSPSIRYDDEAIRQWCEKVAAAMPPIPIRITES